MRGESIDSSSELRVAAKETVWARQSVSVETSLLARRRKSRLTSKSGARHRTRPHRYERRDHQDSLLVYANEE